MRPTHLGSLAAALDQHQSPQPRWHAQALWPPTFHVSVHVASQVDGESGERRRLGQVGRQIHLCDSQSTRTGMPRHREPRQM